jgi:hypothetical protein
MIGARGLGWAAAVSCALALAACGQHRTATVHPPPPAGPVATPVDKDEPVPVAAPRDPVQTEEIAAPQYARPNKKS